MLKTAPSNWDIEDLDSQCIASLSNGALNGSFKALRERRWIQFLDVSRNALTTIEGLIVLCNLRYLDLSHNNLCVFSANSSFRRLVRLDCSYNRLEVVQLSGCEDLLTADFSHNQISLLGGFYGCYALQELQLRNNALKDVFELIYLQRSHVSLMDLGENGIPLDVAAKLLPKCRFAGVGRPNGFDNCDENGDANVSEGSEHTATETCEEEHRKNGIEGVEQPDSDAHASEEKETLIDLDSEHLGAESPEILNLSLKIVDFVQNDTGPKTVVRTIVEDIKEAVCPESSPTPGVSSFGNVSSASISILREQSQDALKGSEQEVISVGRAQSKQEDQQSEDKIKANNLLNSSIINEQVAESYCSDPQPSAEVPLSPCLTRLALMQSQELTVLHNHSAAEDSNQRHDESAEEEVRKEDVTVIETQARHLEDRTAYSASNDKTQPDSFKLQDSEHSSGGKENNIEGLPIAVFSPIKLETINPFKQMVPEIPIAQLNMDYQPSSPNISARLYGRELLSLSDDESDGLNEASKPLKEIQPPDVNSSMPISENYTDDFGKHSLRQNTNAEKSEIASGRINNEIIHIPAASDSVSNVITLADTLEKGDALIDGKSPAGGIGAATAAGTAKTFLEVEKSPPAPTVPPPPAPQQRRSISTQSDSRQWREGQNASAKPVEIIERGGQQFRKIQKKKRLEKSVFGK